MVQFLTHVSKEEKDRIKICFHKKKVFDDSRGEIICNFCGEVLNEKIDSSDENVNLISSSQFSKDFHHGDTNRWSLDDGLSTIIDIRKKDFTGKFLPAKNNLDFYRLRKWDSRIKIGNKRYIRDALILLNSTAFKLHLSTSIIETASSLYRKASSQGIVRGSGVNQVVGAALYLACKSANIPRSIKEIANLLNIKPKWLYHSMAKIEKEINFQTGLRNPVDYVPILGGKLGCSEKVKRQAFEILKKIEGNAYFMGKNPYLLCATAIWFSLAKSGWMGTRTKFCEICGTSTVSLRNQIEYFRKRASQGDFRLEN